MFLPLINLEKREQVVAALVEVRGVVGWYAFVALAVTAYMIGIAFGITLLPENALLGLIGTVAVATVVGGISKIIEALKPK